MHMSFEDSDSMHEHDRTIFSGIDEVTEFSPAKTSKVSRRVVRVFISTLYIEM